MSTLPDMRDMPIPAEMKLEPTRTDMTVSVGYVCAAAIVIVMLCKDGAVAIAAAAGVAGTLAGISFIKRSVS